MANIFILLACSKVFVFFHNQLFINSNYSSIAEASRYINRASNPSTKQQALFQKITFGRISRWTFQRFPDLQCLLFLAGKMQNTSLLDIVNELAGGNQTDVDLWISELERHSVRKIEDLIQIACSSYWESFLEHDIRSTMLKVKLGNWRRALQKTDLKAQVKELWESSKGLSPEEENALEYLFIPPTDAFYRLFKVDYLNLPESKETIKTPIYILTAPSGSGKTKFIFDLALYKGHQVIYIDWTNYTRILKLIETQYYAYFREHGLSNDMSDSDRNRHSHVFSLCINQGVELFEAFFKWLIFIADEISHLQPYQFIRFWVENAVAIQAKILDFLNSEIAPPFEKSHKKYVFAFDESQMLLEYLYAGEVYAFVQSTKYRGSLYTIFSRTCDLFSSSFKIIISGTSIKLSLMSQHSSLIRKNQYFPIKIPFFSEDNVQSFLLRFGVPLKLTTECKYFLVGRPLSSLFFLESWKASLMKVFDEIPLSLPFLKSFLINETIEKMVEVFRRKDGGDPSVYMSRVGSRDKNLTLRRLLSDLCIYGNLSLGLVVPDLGLEKYPGIEIFAARFTGKIHKYL
jgi:hypothetical protein